MTSKTISLSGAELKVNYSGGANAWLRNDGTSAVYASAAPDISAGADGVVSIPAGQAAPIYGANGTVYLLGTGSVMLIGSDYAQCPFKTSAQSGGSGADEIARAAIEAHAADADIHVTAAEKAGWNAVSNPNLLINPDFRINQRGESTVSAGADRVFFSDRWHAVNVDVAVGSEITIHGSGANGFIQQIIENSSYYFGKAMAISADIDGNRYSAALTVPNTINGIASQEIKPGISLAICNYMNSEIPAAVLISDTEEHQINNIKLEFGSAATPFLPPDPAMELEDEAARLRLELAGMEE